VQLETIHRNYEPTKKVLSELEERADKFTKYANDSMQVRFTLSGEGRDFVCEVHVHLKGKDLHSRADSHDMLSSVDRASSAMEEQLRRYKAKRVSQHQRGQVPGRRSAAALEATFDQPDEETPAD
jgi:ribosomal subunit interface protein